jgi:CBS domain-containing protein
VRLDTTFGFAIAKLLATEAHHVWVTDKGGQAIGLLSLRDIIKPLSAISI